MVFFQKLLVHPWLIIKSFKICFTGEFDEVLIAGQIRGQQDEMIVIVVRESAVFLGVAAAGRHIGFTADDGFDPVRLGFLIKLNRAKQVAMVGHGHGRHAEGFDLLYERFDLIGAVEKTELGVQMQMDEGSTHEGGF